MVESGADPVGGPQGTGHLLGAWGSALVLAGFLVLVIQRLVYPFELEWLEGISLLSIERIRQGLPLYAQPDLGWCPLPYGPLYFYGAWAMEALGATGFLAPRLASALATGGLFLAVGACAQRAGVIPRARRATALVAAGLVAAAYPFCGAWLDLARPDSLALALLLLAAWSHLRCAAPHTWGAACMTAALALASYHTKQTVLLPVLGFMWLDWPRSRKTCLIFALGLGASLSLASLWTGGWYEFHTLKVLAGHGVHWPGLMEFFGRDLRLAAPVLVLAALGWRGAPRPLRGLFLGGVGASLLGRLHPGGYDNVLLPMIVCAAPLAAAGWARVPPMGNLALVVLVVLGSLSVPGLVPSEEDSDAGEKLVERIRGLEGEVFAPAYGYLLERAGKTPQLHLMSWMDLSASDQGLALAQGLVDELRGRLERGEFAHALVGDPQDPGEAEFVNLLRQYLPVEEALLPAEGPGSMTPASGAPRSPRLLLSAAPR